MFRIAVVNPLRVEVVLPAALYPVVRKGVTLRITPDFPGAAPRLATVSLVDGVIEGASNTFRARLALPNPNNGLPAGLRCKADLPGGEQSASARPASGPPAAAPLRATAPAGLSVRPGL